MQRCKSGPRLVNPSRAALACAALTLAAAAPAAAQALDTSSIWTVQVENDAVSTLKGTSDQYYTSGIRLGWTSGQDVVGPVAALGHALWGGGTTRLSLQISQSLFTPSDTQIAPPNPNDRPYAGELLGTAALIHDSSWTRDLLSASFGVIGPDAQGEQVQNGFHDIIGDTPNKGWQYQIKNQVAFELLGQRTWRLPIAQFAGIEADALPSATAAVGDVRDYVQLGGIFRIGQGLNSDFGSARIEPGLNGADAYTQTRPIVWYGFAGIDGQAVGYDVSLDGASFGSQPGPSVQRTWDVGEIEAGVAIILYGLRVSYTQTWQTKEFQSARSGLFNFGSLTVSAKF